mmetsp:Transcript_110590/g.276998  ORF Transcript_110590/g.276998 Transcript_110590/m.276998 type:complete len:229 (+) Transcript_110590:809-1495(+)
MAPMDTKASVPPRSSRDVRTVSACIATFGRNSRWPGAIIWANFEALRCAQRTRSQSMSRSSPLSCEVVDSKDAPVHSELVALGAIAPEPQPLAATAVLFSSTRAATKSNTASSPATSISSASKISARTAAGNRSNAVRISGFARKGWNFRTISSTAPSRICLNAAPSSVPGMWNLQYCSKSKGAVSENAASIRLPMASKRPPMPKMSAIFNSNKAFEAGASNTAWFSE